MSIDFDGICFCSLVRLTIFISGISIDSVFSFFSRVSYVWVTVTRQQLGFNRFEISWLIGFGTICLMKKKFVYIFSEAKKRRKETSESTEDDTTVDSKGKSENMFNLKKLICNILKCPSAR